MKKAATCILTAVLALGIGTTGVFAAGMGCGRHYVDADGNGICDRCSVYTNGGTGGNGAGRYYTDTDGDGICDHYTDGTCPQNAADWENGSHRGRHHRSGNGHGRRHGSGNSGE